MAETSFSRVDIDCVVTHNAAIATARGYKRTRTGYLPEFVEASGTAVRHPEDKFVKDVAENLAIGRALENLGKKLQKRANGVVKQNEDNAARKVRQQAEADKKNKRNRSAGASTKSATK